MRFQMLLSAIVCSACAEPTVRLLATAQDLEEGTELTAAHLVEVKVSRALATSNAVRPEQASTLVGKRPRVALSKGDLVLASYFESDPALAALVTQRARSVTLSVSGAENLHAGDHVDLIAVVRDPQTNDFVAITLAQNVIVLAPGALQPHGADEVFPLRRVSFLVLSEEAEVALLALGIGALHVSLRNPNDLDIMEERGRSNINTVLSGERIKVLGQRRRAITLDRGAKPHRIDSPSGASEAPVPTLPGKTP